MKKIIIFLTLFISNLAFCLAISKDSILIKIRNHEFEKVAEIIKNDKNNILPDQVLINDQLDYYNNLVSEFGIYTKKPIAKIKNYVGRNLQIKAINHLNLGLYMLLYEYNTESEAFINLQKALAISEKTKDNILTCEILKAIFFYYSRIIEVENNDYKFYSNLHLKYAYDDLELQIQKIYNFYLKVEFKKPNFEISEVSELKAIAGSIKNPFYNSFANKSLAIYNEIQLKNYSQAIWFYNAAIVNKLDEKYGVNFYFKESLLNCKADCLKKIGKYEEATNLFLIKKPVHKGKTADWLIAFKYSMLSDLYSARKIFDSALYYREKTRDFRNEFAQTKHDAIINQLNSNIKDQEIDKKQQEIAMIQRKYAVVGTILFSFLSIFFTYRWKQNKINKIRLKAKQEKLNLYHQNEILQKELERQKSIQLERERISHDMHDDLGAGISALKLQTEFLKEKLKDNLSLQSDLDELLKTSADMNLSMREMLWNLNKSNDTLQSLVQYISAYAENFFSKTKMKLQVQKNLSVIDLPISSDVRWHLFLCMKESLNNIYKHSQATVVTLKFELLERKFTVEIEDDGIGLQNLQNTGNGFNNMNERMKECAGKFEIISALKGVHLHFFLQL